MLRGYSNKLIARELDLSPETVKVYRKRVNRKLGTSSSRQIFTSFFALPSDTTLTLRAGTAGGRRATAMAPRFGWSQTVERQKGPVVTAQRSLIRRGALGGWH